MQQQVGRGHHLGHVLAMTEPGDARGDAEALRQRRRRLRGLVGLGQASDQELCVGKRGQRVDHPVGALGLRLQRGGQPDPVLVGQVERAAHRLPHPVAAIFGLAARSGERRRQQVHALQLGSPRAPIFQQLALAQQDRPGLVVGAEGILLDVGEGAIARQELQIGLPAQPVVHRGIGAIEHVEAEQLVEADGQIALRSRFP